ncbi:MAG TPA: hypothetical protein VG122_14250 [Gemmata sp.]|jgi:hypothetical protein|nr:hypothetical protein [Gemmata sp.]
MKPFLIAAACAVMLGLGTSSKAHAQIVYGYSTPVYGGVESTGTVITPFGGQTFTNFFSPFTGNIGQTSGTTYTPFGARTYSNFYSPFTGTVGQSYTTNIFGAANTRAYGYNPYTGIRYGTGFYQPNTYVAPFGGYNYSWMRQR